MASKRDRDKLRSRIRGLLEEEGRTQKDLEGALGLSGGTLSRLFGGKRNLDAELLASLAEGLDADPASLVEGTAWEVLVGGAPPPPEVAAPGAPEEEAEVPEEEEEPTAESPAPTEEGAPPAAAEAPRREEPRREEPPREEAPRAEAPRAPGPPPPRKRTRKRDLPGMAIRFLADLIFG